MQIVLFSKKLSPAERNCDISNRELLAIKLALAGHWLEGDARPFMFLTDHKHLKCLHTAKLMNPCQA